VDEEDKNNFIGLSTFTVKRLRQTQSVDLFICLFGVEEPISEYPVPFNQHQNRRWCLRCQEKRYRNQYTGNMILDIIARTAIFAVPGK